MPSDRFYRVADPVKQIIELDERYRSSWDTRSIGHAVGLGHTTAAKILREHRGSRPRPKKRPHDRHTRFLRRDVMRSSDFMSLPDGRKLIKTMRAIAFKTGDPGLGPRAR